MHTRGGGAKEKEKVRDANLMISPNGMNVRIQYRKRANRFIIAILMYSCSCFRSLIGRTNIAIIVISHNLMAIHLK